MRGIDNASTCSDCGPKCGGKGARIVGNAITFGAVLEDIEDRGTRRLRARNRCAYERERKNNAEAELSSL